MFKTLYFNDYYSDFRGGPRDSKKRGRYVGHHGCPIRPYSRNKRQRPVGFKKGTFFAGHHVGLQKENFALTFRWPETASKNMSFLINTL